MVESEYMEESERQRLLNSRPNHAKELAEDRPSTTSYGFPKKPKESKRLLVWLIVMLIVAGGVAGIWAYDHRSDSLVPKVVRGKIDFPIYYPDPAKLPAGFVLDSSSFKSVSPEAVLYIVNYGTNKKLVFTVQKKPSDSELDNFNKQYIPIHRQVSTSVGTATIGAIGNQTVVSLPTKDSSWILMTGAPDMYNTSNLAQVLKAIRKAD